jgi:hypothetical protein
MAGEELALAALKALDGGSRGRRGLDRRRRAQPARNLGSTRTAVVTPGVVATTRCR